MRRWSILAALALILCTYRPALADAVTWPAAGRSPGPGGVATIVVESPAHGSRVPGPNIEVRLRTDNPRAAVRIKLDGKYLAANGGFHTPRPGRPNEGPQWSFRESPEQLLLIPVHGLGPGLHTLEVTRGGPGAELPLNNEQRITFTVSD